MNTTLYKTLEAANTRGLSLKQTMLLIQLSDDPMTMTAISKDLGASTAAITGMVDRMEKLGLVMRHHGLADRRKIVVSITDKGERIVHHVTRAA